MKAEYPVDWNEVWRQQMVLSVEAGQSCAQTFESASAAQKYWEQSLADRGGRVRAVLDSLSYLDCRASLLDIGGGPGTVAIPMARRLARVDVVEPSPGMAAVLKRNIRRCRARNIHLVQKTWEETDPSHDLNAPYDVTLIAFAFGMEDLRGALEKAIQITSHRIFLYWFNGSPGWMRHRERIWPALHQRAYSPPPKANVIYNLLYEMGIYPNVETCEYEYQDEYDSLESMVNGMAVSFQAQGEEKRAILRGYLEQAAVQAGEKYVLPGKAIFSRIWWDVKNPFYGG